MTPKGGKGTKEFKEIIKIRKRKYYIPYPFLLLCTFHKLILLMKGNGNESMSVAPRKCAMS